MTKSKPVRIKSVTTDSERYFEVTVDDKIFKLDIDEVITCTDMGLQDILSQIFGLKVRTRRADGTKHYSQVIVDLFIDGSNSPSTFFYSPSCLTTAEDVRDYILVAGKKIVEWESEDAPAIKFEVPIK